jgi:cytosine/adenosine deaminase-related metal-dependent hydrolase
LICNHHHIYQNLTRNWVPDKLAQGLFEWLKALYPVWARLDEESSFLSTYVALAEMALGGCTTTSDHLNIHPKPKLIDAQIAAAKEVGLRFHPTRGAMNLSQKDGCLPSDDTVEEDDVILADCERLVKTYHDRSHGAMIRIALAPCNPFAVTNKLMCEAATLAEKLDVRLHTHLAESLDEEKYCLCHHHCRPLERLEQVGWDTGRAWVAHAIYLNDEEIAKMGRWKMGAAHCPTSNILFNQAIGPVYKMHQAGVPVGLGVDGAASAGHQSLWMEAHMAMLVGQLRKDPTLMMARDALKIATVGGAQCLGREGELGVLACGAAADLVVWPTNGIYFSGVQDDLVEAWLRDGPIAAKHTIVNGKFVVRNGELQLKNLEANVKRHHAISTEWHQSAFGS